MIAGTAQKLVLSMISTSGMIRLGRIRGNKMIDMHLSNNKLFERGIKDADGRAKPKPYFCREAFKGTWKCTQCSEGLQEITYPRMIR